MKKRLQSLLLVLLLLAAALLMAACKSADEIEDARASQQAKTTQEIVIKQEVQREKHVLTVTGTGSIDVDPDIATVQLSVVVQAATAEEAQLSNSALMADVLRAVKAKGIRESDIKTQEITVIPLQDAKNQQEITGYNATNTISLRIRDVKRTSEVIDAAVQAGANVVLPLEFYLLDETQHYQDALAAAVQNAYTKAEIAAEAGNFRIVGALTVHEDMEAAANTPDVLLYEGIVPTVRQEADEGEEPEAVTVTPLQAGQLTVNAQVTVEFEYTWLPAQSPAPEE